MKASTIIIRRFEPMDFGEVLEIEKLSFNESHPFLFMRIHENFPEGFLVAEMNGKVVGYLIFIETGIGGRILSFAVHPSFRNRGVGSLLLGKALEVMKKLGLRTAMLEVRKSNLKAQKLYRKFGFEPVGEIPKYYRDGEDAILMERMLND
ncbi:MAG: [ribosomal protein S18]-alanine N-acetyltransferase [Archaeoglobi archaeon]|nr:ribosomal protein S18-alanine N-acetyltransferase [Candidatus Mnemosynella bozhongmuii]MDI3502103.1 [ribosomal protein S18]-alanine N-acetyltransferase [Archaeoglobi archaeon]MDK2781102.1 [ribosomal protein S18]-alanine N-acetyltransferase [Archaeoglobi archaeon]